MIRIRESIAFSKARYFASGFLENAIAAREAHLKLSDEMETENNRWYGAVIQDDQGNMIGSMAVLDLPSENELNRYLA